MLVESGKWEQSLPLTMENLRQVSLERFEEIDFDNAKKDVYGLAIFISITEDYFS